MNLNHIIKEKKLSSHEVDAIVEKAIVMLESHTFKEICDHFGKKYTCLQQAFIRRNKYISLIKHEYKLKANSNKKQFNGC